MLSGASCISIEKRGVQIGGKHEINNHFISLNYLRSTTRSKRLELLLYCIENPELR
jgi:hypothetical protein